MQRLCGLGHNVTVQLTKCVKTGAYLTIRRISSDDSPPADAGPDVTREKAPTTVKSPVAGLLAQHAALERSINRRISALTGRATRLRRDQERQDAKHDHSAPRAAVSAYQPHHNLESFLDYAEEVNLKTTTTVFKGTLYEYTVAEALKAYSMTLNRVGKSNDFGIDLLGHWALPESKSLRVLVQCKMTKTMPSMIRELEGSYVGAPSGWQGDNVLALLASRHVATPGTQLAIQRSRWPIGFLQVSTEGVVKQFIWNTAAIDCGLAGVSVASRYSTTESSKIESSLALRWLDGPWPTTNQQEPT